MFRVSWDSCGDGGRGDRDGSSSDPSLGLREGRLSERAARGSRLKRGNVGIAEVVGPLARSASRRNCNGRALGRVQAGSGGLEDVY